MKLDKIPRECRGLNMNGNKIFKFDKEPAWKEQHKLYMGHSLIFDQENPQ